ncbi:MAG: helix-turn-helix domain-containing protein [Streptosporangiaceae bacterium]
MSIGEALAGSRREAGLTVTDVSRRTRIRETIITGIEEDDYSGCGGDFYARGHIRSIARVVGVDPEPLIREYDTALLGPESLEEDDDITEPVPVVRTRELRRPNWSAALGVALVVVLGFVAYYFLAGSRHAAGGTAPPRSHPARHHHPGPASSRPPQSRSPSPSPSGQTTAPAVAAQALTPASATAFEPFGGGQGDDPGGAALAIDGKPSTAWHTDWYTSAHMGNLYPGTGLLVNMGRPVTITAAQVTLGSAPGADFQLRVGNTPSMAGLPAVAGATNASGVVSLRLTAPAHGRYVLIWFTGLPPDTSGSFEASVYEVRLEGQS